MKVLITGICGFVGSTLAQWFRRHVEGIGLVGIDNLSRRGSELNRDRLRTLGVDLRHGDVRNASDLESLPATDWVIDAAANPSVTAGVDGAVSPRQVVEHNLYGTVNILEYCRRGHAGFVLLSTSRVYSIRGLARLPLVVDNEAFVPDATKPLPAGVSREGLGVEFPCTAPVSIYGSTKLASEALALEYGEAFGFPVWINRCGVMAGAGQFGTPEQGIFSYWLHAFAGRRPLRYIGFGGRGWQVRDAFHPDDLAVLILRQIQYSGGSAQRLFNIGGGTSCAMSLAQLTVWCRERFGSHEIGAAPQQRPFDIPWLVMDSRDAKSQFGWVPQRNLASILEEIAVHATKHPTWLEMTGAV